MAREDYSETDIFLFSFYPAQNGNHKKIAENAGNDAEKGEPLFAAGRNVN